MRIPLSIRPKLMELIKSEFEKRIGEMESRLISLLKAMDEQFFSLFYGSFKKGQINILKESPFSGGRVARYSELNYQVWFFKDSRLLLGDSMVFFKVAGDRGFKPFVDRDDVLEAVFLPIASNAILVGSSIDVGSNYDLDLINAEVAKASLEYFVASVDSYENKVLSQEIGKNSHLMLDEEVEAIAKSFFTSRL